MISKFHACVLTTVPITVTSLASTTGTSTISPSITTASQQEPIWGTEQPPSLNVACVRVSANTEKAELDVTKTQRKALRQDVSDLGGLVASNVAKLVEKGTTAEVLVENSVKTRAKESARKEGIAKAVNDADLKCRELGKTP